MAATELSIYPTLDTFAFRLSTCLPRYMSWRTDSLAAGKDAMLHQCDKVTYLFQPVPLMLRVLQKFSQSQYQPCSSSQYGPLSLCCGSPASGTFSSATTSAASLHGCSDSVESRVLTSSPGALNSSSCGFPNEPAALDLDEEDLTFVYIFVYLMELQRYTEVLWESFYLLFKKQLRPLHLFTSGRGQICLLIISEGAEYSTINLHRSAIF